VQPTQSEKNVASEDQLRSWIRARGISGQRVISGHVGVNYLNSVLVDELRKIASTLCVQRVSQRERRDVFSSHIPELVYQRRVRAKRNINIVAATNKTVCEIGKVSLAAAESLS